MDDIQNPPFDQRPRPDPIQNREVVHLADRTEARKWHAANCSPQIPYPKDSIPNQDRRDMINADFIEHFDASFDASHFNAGTIARYHAGLQHVRRNQLIERLGDPAKFKPGRLRISIAVQQVEHRKTLIARDTLLTSQYRG